MTDALRAKMLVGIAAASSGTGLGVRAGGGERDRKLV
jgi:hypothetical protein